MTSASELAPGRAVWAALEPVRGRGQGGHRPVLVVASAGYLDAVTTLAIVLPITTTDRGWPNHVVVDGPSGLDLPSWIMTEQPRTLSRDRLTGTAGEVTRECLASVTSSSSEERRSPGTPQGPRRPQIVEAL
ncbi:type II toxin-antitoxin system PemK/MazF family toxin [Microbacterium oxydans]|uniref:type II toxin-antitoxin system PemK/MazF family toxin n=1 Tax=Microbacterium oxydans TaxID=82380 RepID=UPI0037C941D8